MYRIMVWYASSLVASQSPGADPEADGTGVSNAKGFPKNAETATKLSPLTVLNLRTLGLRRFIYHSYAVKDDKNHVDRSTWHSL
jgi:hypothetical protein